jgi:hypothetical protein
MIYLDPKSDIAFKKLFGSITHKNILISFLNSILQRPEGLKIVDVVINDPTNVPDTRSSKLSIVDVRCTDQSGCLYPASFKEKEPTDAFNILAQSNWSKPELESYDRYLDNIRSEMNQLDTAEAKGLAKGEQKKALEIARKLLDILDIKTIAQKTGLSIEQVQKLKP